MTADVLFERNEQLGLITLNRPRALNALTLDMIRAMDRTLAAWAVDDRVKAVVVQGNGKAFCAGGDVVAMIKAVRARTNGQPDDFNPAYFLAEYNLDRRIRLYPKPYISLLDGVTMGGGIGISQHGSHRIATEKTLWAMPETAIGFYPDVGMTHVLPRVAGGVGLWLGLTGARLEAADLLHLGLATAFIPSEALPAFLDDLHGASWGGSDAATVDHTIGRHALTVRKPAPILANLDAINRCFQQDTVEAILAALDQETGEWASQQRYILKSMSPTSLKVTLRALCQGRLMDFDDCLAIEYHLSLAFCDGHDFPEGVRALLIDKDRTPRWCPASVEDVTGALVDGFFSAARRPNLVFAS